MTVELPRPDQPEPKAAVDHSVHSSADPIDQMSEGYPEEEGDSDEDAWSMTGRE